MNFVSTADSTEVKLKLVYLRLEDLKEVLCEVKKNKHFLKDHKLNKLLITIQGMFLSSIHT